MWRTKARSYAVEQRYDVILETAMRTPAESEEIVAAFRAGDYRIEVAVPAVPESLSRLGVAERCWQEVNRHGHGWLINAAAHDA